MAVSPGSGAAIRLILVHLQRRDEGLLENLGTAELAHLLFAFLCLSRRLRLASRPSISPQRRPDQLLVARFEIGESCTKRPEARHRTNDGQIATQGMIFDSRQRRVKRGNAVISQQI